MGIDSQIVDYSAAVLIRYFRGGSGVSGAAPRFDAQRDSEILRGHWAISGPVRALVGYVLTHPHEAQSLLSSRIRVDDAVARGRINAVRTWAYRIQTGLPTAVVTSEPVRSFNTGPNLLLAWVLREAATFTARLAQWQGPAMPYFSVIEQAQKEIASVQRIEALREPLRAVLLGQRPTSGVVQLASRARQPIYKLAVQAYLLLQGLERFEPSAINTVAQTALIGPLEDWRRFELAVALAVGEALGTVCGLPVELRVLGGISSAPIITSGQFAVHWQQKTAFYVEPDREPSEEVTASILNAYGFSGGPDRPDLVIVDQASSSVIAVIEVKYLAGDTGNARFREAVDQVVRYARGYAATGDTSGILSRSLVALSAGAPIVRDPDAGVPFAVDFDGIVRGDLTAWASKIVAGLI